MLILSINSKLNFIIFITLRNGIRNSNGVLKGVRSRDRVSDRGFEFPRNLDPAPTRELDFEVYFITSINPKYS